MLSCHRSRRQIRARSVGGFGGHALGACANGLGVGTDINQASGVLSGLGAEPPTRVKANAAAIPNGIPKKRQAQTVPNDGDLR